MVRSWHLNVAAAILALVGLTAVFVGSAGDSWAAPNLVANGGFETDVNNWTAVNADADWTHDNAVDRFGGDVPGSGLLALAGAADTDADVASDCIAIGATGAYDYTFSTGRGSQWTHASVTPSTANSSYVNLLFDQYDSADCTGSPATSSGHGDELLAAAGWFDFSGTLNIVSGSVQSLQLTLRVHGQATGDEANLDEVGVALGALDTPTPSNTPTATNTSVATDTPAPTNTSVATNTPVTTETPEPTETPEETHTLVPTDTPTAVPPTSTNTSVVSDPPAADIEDTELTGAGGEQPEDAVGAGGEEPEGAEFPESGYGPGAYEQGGSHTTDVIAAAAFAMAVAMLAGGFYLRRRVEQGQAL
jgi:hypothetical protein